ncbi:MAG TPA: NAD(P)-dependent oxidoreductase [Gemmataceae bacterium]|jgi:nucleoside-diphosphate-sugar epimerase|nr:NAD(P)-dependent oxidoreductase [Gemmataceae bacterium]
MKKRVLLTGSSGRIGRAVAAELVRRGHDVRGFDLVPTPILKDMVVGTLTDRAAIDRATAGRDTLIHLAATPDDADFIAEILPNNLLGVYHILESAQQAGIRRLILASSGQVVWYERLTAKKPIGVDTQPTPKFWYAAGKLFLEGAGRAFAEKFGLSVLAVRLGWCPRSKEQIDEIAASDWAKDVYLSPDDAGRFFADAAESAQPDGYAVVYASSRPLVRQYMDMEPTVRITGYQPRQQWPEGTEIVLGGG